MRCAFALMIGTALIAASAQADPRDIGLTSATKNEVIVVSGADRRGLKIGDRVFQEQHIRTGADSAVQLLFLDETALTVGPNSALILDKAVFDPDKKTGELSVRAVSGAFRFVSGTSPSRNYTITTPAGTIGVRGTWFDVAISGEVMRLLVRRGAVDFCNVARQCLRLPAGYEIRANRTQISPPKKAKHETVNSVIKLWLAPGTGELANLAPGAGPEDSGSEGSYWWKVNLGPDFLPGNNRGPASPVSLPGTPPETEPPPVVKPPVVTPPPVVIKPPPPNLPPNPKVGFPPITNSGVGIPPGLDKKTTLPPGLTNRGPTFLPPGQQKKN